jgi:serine/threonine protein kinase
LDINYRAYLADLGLALTLHSQFTAGGQTTRAYAVGGQQAGTASYLSPELLGADITLDNINNELENQGTEAGLSYNKPSTAHPTTASDMYGIGVILWELFTQQIPWKNLDQPRIIAALIAGKRLPISNQQNEKYYLPPVIHDLCTQLFSTANKRPSAGVVLHALIKMRNSLS